MFVCLHTGAPLHAAGALVFAHRPRPQSADVDCVYGTVTCGIFRNFKIQILDPQSYNISVSMIVND